MDETRKRPAPAATGNGPETKLTSQQRSHRTAWKQPPDRDFPPQRQLSFAAPGEATGSALLMSARNTAKALSISERKLWSLTKPLGPIPSVPIGRRVLYDPDDLRAWIDQQKGGR